jgi:LysM repeat protein
MERMHSRIVGLLTISVLAALLVGCSKPATAQSTASGAGYSSALDTSYEGALDVTTQLALGTLRVEDTGDAVNEEQAARLLPLWKSLQGSVLQGDSERSAVVRQIEGAMSEAQVSSIAAMRLTQEDVQAWAQSQGPGFQGSAGRQGSADQQGPAGGQGSGGRQGQGGAPSGMTEEQIAQMRQQFQNMSPEERATRGEQFGGQGRAGSGAARQAGGAWGGPSGTLIGAVVALLSERAGIPVEAAAARSRPERATPTLTPPPDRQAAGEATSAPAPQATPTPTVDVGGTATTVSEPDPSQGSGQAPTQTPVPATPVPTSEPTVYSVRAGDSLAAIARAYGVTVEAIVEANGIQDPNAIQVGQRLVVPDPARVPAAVVASGTTAGGAVPASSAQIPALERLPDTDPGPPFTIEISANRATQDPLVEKSRQYLVTGIVRNTGDRTYAVSAIDVTFYDAGGFRGSFRKYPLVPGGEWLWHGKTEAEFPCLLLAPGEGCPFLVEITAQDMASFLIHPNAIPTERKSARLEPGNVRVVEDGTGYVRISGTATNSSSYKVKNVTVAGVLLDAKDEIVSLGATYVLQENIEPGASVSFDLRIKKKPYTRYSLYAQAEQD